MSCPLSYGFCGQTVTIYRKTPEGILRFLLKNAFLDRRDVRRRDALGDRTEREFLLILPGNRQTVFPGDRIYEGIGPEKVDWERFVPAAVPEVMEVSYARPFRWEGEICHTEAGRRWKDAR